MVYNLVVFGSAAYFALEAKNVDVSGTTRWTRYTIVGVVWIALAVVLAVIREVRAERINKGKLGNSDFLDLYSTSLYDALAVIQDCKDAERADLLVSLESVLSLIETVVAAHKNRDNLKIRANLMISEPIDRYSDADFGKNVKFVQKGLSKSQYSHVLRLIAWSSTGHDVADGFALPVAIDDSQVLFGAPKAFHSGEIQHMNDCGQIKLKCPQLMHQTKSVKDDILSHFRGVSFKSFVSIRIECGKRRVGVLSIQSNQTDVFGVTKGNEQELNNFIKPFVGVIGIILENSKVRDEL